jgi:hypothetical protein
MSLTLTLDPHGEQLVKCPLKSADIEESGRD